MVRFGIFVKNTQKMSEFKQVIKDGARTVGKSIRKFFTAILLLALVAGGAALLIANMTYSSGQRAGTLIKISHKGVVFKTYEGQLNLGGVALNEQDGLSGNIWEFSVQKEEIYHKLQDLQGQNVKLYYKQKYKGMPWQGKTDYYVYKVDLVHKME